MQNWCRQRVIPCVCYGPGLMCAVEEEERRIEGPHFVWRVWSNSNFRGRQPQKCTTPNGCILVNKMKKEPLMEWKKKKRTTEPENTTVNLQTQWWCNTLPLRDLGGFKSQVKFQILHVAALRTRCMSRESNEEQFILTASPRSVTRRLTKALIV